MYLKKPELFTMDDNYDHPDNKLLYVVENIPGPTEDNEEYSELLNKFNSQLTNKCECKGICLDESCFCINNSRGTNYMFPHYNDLQNYKLVEDKKCSRYSIFECNERCLCFNNCGNKLVQKGPCKNLTVRICDNKEKGFGLHTKNFLAKGSFICEYAGELITKSQVLKRHQKNIANKEMNYIFCLNEHSNGKVTQTFVDPSSIGNIGRYINHSCDPNCHITPVRINSPLPKLAIFSLCDIIPGQEVTIDYGSNTLNSYNDITNNPKPHPRKCSCNSKNCKELLPYNSY